MKFADQHPAETLIIVTGDHETGGMTMGFAGAQYSTFFDKIGPQKMSYVAFNDSVLKPYKKVTPKETATLDDLAPAIKDAFGLDIASLSQPRRQQLEGAFQRTMDNEIERSSKEEEYLLYGGYEPLTVMLTHLLNQNAGISFSPSSLPPLASFYCFYPPGSPRPTRREPRSGHNARITGVDNSLVQQIGPLRHGSQQLELRVLSGTFKGWVLDTTNDLMGKLELDKFFQRGDTAFVVLDLTQDRTDIAFANVIDHYRLDVTWLLLGTFSLALISFAGWTGVKALVSFVFSGITILKLLLPAMLHGWSPVWTTFAMVTVLTFVIIFLVGGFTRKGLVSFLGALGGIGLTTILGILFSALFKIHGVARP